MDKDKLMKTALSRKPKFHVQQRISMIGVIIMIVSQSEWLLMKIYLITGCTDLLEIKCN